MKIATKFNRCIEFTLPTGEVITAKVLGDKDTAKANTAKLISALTAKA